ncbi:Rha family transcriptional regulator [Acinetobacter piscicola]|uniref:DNA-binding protein n=3 Tax=Acinetobacter TaxID=469 RepID=A0A7S6VY07_9GAMM|nr:phage antirepressor KilAC domain-containing protein [Acinetobacter piscicola]QOW46968.1 DNA-binding protein [Acinetobacter piscicola]
MNELIVKSSQLTMSTRLIAELTGKEHFHVKRDCETMFSELDLDPKGYIQNWIHPQNGQTYTEYLLPKNLVETLITGYSIKLRYQVIQRLHELENCAKSAVPQTFSEALQLAADQAKQLELAAPKVTYYDTVVERSTLLNASQVAQKIKMSAIKMNKILDSLNVYHRGVKRARLFQQWFIDKGFGEVKQTELGFSQPMFTTLGEAWVIEKLVSEGVLEA